MTSLMDEMKLSPEHRRQAEDLFCLGKQKSDVDLGSLMGTWRKGKRRDQEEKIGRELGG